MTDASDDDLRQWAHSFAHPPKLDAQGAQVAAEPYAPERRALRLTVQNKSVAITIIPAGRCVNPVFELKDAPRRCPCGWTISRCRRTGIAGTARRFGSAPTSTGRRRCDWNSPTLSILAKVPAPQQEIAVRVP